MISDWQKNIYSISCGGAEIKVDKVSPLTFVFPLVEINDILRRSLLVNIHITCLD